jgi:hypothetical protein
LLSPLRGYSDWQHAGCAPSFAAMCSAEMWSTGGLLWLQKVPCLDFQVTIYERGCHILGIDIQ